MSNAFSDEKITDNYTTLEIVVKSINSGCNMFFCYNNIDSVVAAVDEAVKSGEIKESFIDDSVKKILSVKMKLRVKMF